MEAKAEQNHEEVTGKPKLVLTGHPELWPTNPESAIFAGPWCFINNPHGTFSDYQRYQLLDDIWSDKSEVARSLQYTNQLLDRLVPAMGAYFCKIFKLDRPNRFWLPNYVGWLGSWLGMAYDRYRTITSACGKVGSVDICVNHNLIIESSSHHHHLFDDHGYNLVLYSDIIHELSCMGALDFPYNSCLPTLDITRPPANSHSKSFVSRSLRWLKSFIDQRSLLYLSPGAGINTATAIAIQMQVDPALFFRRPKRRCQIHADPQVVVEPLDFEPQNNFEEVVRRLALKFLPLTSHSIDLIDPGPRVSIFPGTDYSYEEKSFATATVDSHGLWCSHQHGGGYGQLDAMPNEWLEFRYPDKVITWSSKQPYRLDEDKWVRLPSAHLSRLEQATCSSTDIVLFTNYEPIYPYRIQSSPSAFELLPGLEAQLQFVRKLDKDKQERLLLKPYPIDYGTGINERMLASIPRSTTKKLPLLMRDCSLIVISYLGTAILEAAQMNTPFIMFWPRDSFKMNPIFEELFTQFERLGICHFEPASAATWLNGIDDYAAWWAQEDVQEARRRYLELSCLASPSWTSAWIDQCRQMVSANTTRIGVHLPRNG